MFLEYYFVEHYRRGVAEKVEQIAVDYYNVPAA